MAADILLYDADVVPVGKDQKQHIEYTRDIAGKFNFQYAELFKLPNELIMEEVATVPGTDGQKMSKSYHNTIPLFGTDEEITKAVMSIPTDSRGKDEEKNPDDLILHQIHKLFNPSEELKSQYHQGLGYGDAKKMLIADIISFVTPMRERRKKYEDDPKLVQEILLQGAMKANEIAMKKLTDVYESVGLSE
jgi:tryptophanyl-tRNA synthetase